MDTTNASGALDPGSIPGGTTDTGREVLLAVASQASPFDSWRDHYTGLDSELRLDTRSLAGASDLIPDAVDV